MKVSLNANNISYFVLHPFSNRLSRKDQITTLALTAIAAFVAFKLSPVIFALSLLAVATIHIIQKPRIIAQFEKMDELERLEQERALKDIYSLNDGVSVLKKRFNELFERVNTDGLDSGCVLYKVKMESDHTPIEIQDYFKFEESSNKQAILTDIFNKKIAKDLEFFSSDKKRGDNYSVACAIIGKKFLAGDNMETRYEVSNIGSVERSNGSTVSGPSYSLSDEFASQSEKLSRDFFVQFDENFNKKTSL